MDCTWNQWTPWSSCDKCGGQRKRFRHIVALLTCGGRPCEPTDAEVTGNCTRICHEPSFCGFGDWASWGSCSKSCGVGVRSRSRQLELQPKCHDKTKVGKKDVVQADEVDARRSQIEQWATEARGLESQRKAETLTAFACGFVTIALALVIVLRSRGRREAQAPRRLLAAEE